MVDPKLILIWHENYPDCNTVTVCHIMPYIFSTLRDSGYENFQNVFDRYATVLDLISLDHLVDRETVEMGS